MDETFLTVRELAERWGVNPLTIYGWVKEGTTVTPLRLGGGRRSIIRFSLARVVEYERSGGKS